MIGSIFFGAAVYIVIWWLVLFTVLPWGVQSQLESKKVIHGSERGAPVKPLMLKKLLATTIISAILLASGYALSYSGFIDKYILLSKYTADRLR